MAYWITKSRKTFAVSFDWFDVAGIRQTRRVKREEWSAIGFNSSMELGAAKKLAAELNEANRSEKLETKRNKIRLKIEERTATDSLLLPELMVKAFEIEVLFGEWSNEDPERLQRNKYEMHWRTVRQIIVDLRITPDDWKDKRKLIYNRFIKMSLSQQYVGKLLRLMNEWGKFYCKRRSKFFEPIPMPDKASSRSLIVAFRASGKAKKSLPLTPAALELNRSSFDVREYNWLLVSVWFGLRPEEIDLLSDSRKWSFFKDESQKVDVFRVNMPKIVTDDELDSWKLIPVLYFEQRTAIEAIRHKLLKRPTLRKIQKALGEGFGVYAGRKGFELLMRLKGHPELTISTWLGHIDVRTTRQYYKDKTRVTV